VVLRRIPKHFHSRSFILE